MQICLIRSADQRPQPRQKIGGRGDTKFGGPYAPDIGFPVARLTLGDLKAELAGAPRPVDELVELLDELPVNGCF